MTDLQQLLSNELIQEKQLVNLRRMHLECPCQLRSLLVRLERNVLSIRTRLVVLILILIHGWEVGSRGGQRWKGGLGSGRAGILELQGMIAVNGWVMSIWSSRIRKQMSHRMGHWVSHGRGCIGGQR